MGKWFNWMMWGVTYPFLGALLSAMLVFLAINNGDLWKPQLDFLGITVTNIAIVGVIGAAISFAATILISIVFWLVAGVISIKTTSMLEKTSLKGDVNSIFAPWLVLSLMILALNIAISFFLPNPIASLTMLLVDFVISLAINYVFIWVSVFINKLFHFQRFLPA